MKYKILYLFLSVFALASCTKEKEEEETLSNYMRVTINDGTTWDASGFENYLNNTDEAAHMEIIAKSVAGSEFHFTLFDYREQETENEIGTGDYIIMGGEAASHDSYFLDKDSTKTYLREGGIRITQIDPDDKRITGTINLNTEANDMHVEGSFVNIKYTVRN